MSEPKFTPGPWCEVTETRGAEICTIHCCSPRSTPEPEAQRWVYIVSDGSAHRSEREQDANARLIAAAPEMYAALNYVADMTYCGADAEWHFKPGYDPQIVLDAIAKATGNKL